MRKSTIAGFVASFLAGGIVLGGVVAHARLTTYEPPDRMGVTPGARGSMICVTENNVPRIGQGDIYFGFLPSDSGGGVKVATLVCPA